MDRHEACQLRAELNALSNVAWTLNRRLEAAAHAPAHMPVSVDQVQVQAPSSAMAVDSHEAGQVRAEIKALSNVAWTLNRRLEELKDRLPENDGIRAVKSGRPARRG